MTEKPRATKIDPGRDLSLAGYVIASRLPNAMVPDILFGRFADRPGPVFTTWIGPRGQRLTPVAALDWSALHPLLTYEGAV